MPEHRKRRKHHDKDKYYRLAKEQGLRSRAAFKLTQINRKFPFLLEKSTTAILDLCAAPGGWTQITSRTVPRHVQIVAVDILPIRSLGVPNVTTLIGDITTDKCKSDIKRALQRVGITTASVDLVLHDGAPNVGADYSKDAYEQNEISLHALKCACQHLKPGGHFCTKLYRSRDYNSFVWVLQQLFNQVHALKPSASRVQSSEIFLIAQDYKAPAKLDPRFLDPKHVFDQVDGDSSGGGKAANSGMTVFHRDWEKKRRQRGGYDMEHFDATMRHIESIQRFVTVETLKEAVDILSTSTGLAFHCEVCREEDGAKPSCHCSFFLHHPLTNTEIKECCTDLQVLGKTDFRGLIAWRTKMQEALHNNKSDEAEGDEADSRKEKAEDGDDSEKEEEEIQKEIEAMRQRRLKEKKRKKKKERAEAAKRRQRAAFGMDLNAVEVPEHDKVFSLEIIKTKKGLEKASQVNLDQVDDEEVGVGGADDDDDIVIFDDASSDASDDSDDDGKLRRRERDLERAYAEYLSKANVPKDKTKTAKRSKKLQRQLLAQELSEDQAMAKVQKSGIDEDTKRYVNLLLGRKETRDDSDDDDDAKESSSSDDDGFLAEPMTPEEHATLAATAAAKRENPLIHQFDDEPASARTARWFSNPLFSSIGQATAAAIKRSAKDDAESDSDGDEEEAATKSNENGGGKKKKKKVGLDAEEVLASIPKTDKVKRHEKRLKRMARDERKAARRARLSGEEPDFEIAPAEDSTADTAQKKKVLEARKLIKAGMGTAAASAVKESDKIEIVPQQQDVNDDDAPLPRKDTRKYDSENEEYDSDDYAETLALGTMMLRRSKEKQFVDASYNRYAWNDPSGLPEWFVDNERRFYRPQLPIPPALLAKMKEKMMALSVKPIKKVAEARARKSKRAKDKLAAAKKKAEAVANSTEMTEAMKLKAISKALRGQDKGKMSKTYVVAKKGRGMNIKGKGVQVVDKRLKSDKRAMARSEKKRKHGKQGGLVGSKKRRHHR